MKETVKKADGLVPILKNSKSYNVLSPGCNNREMSAGGDRDRGSADLGRPSFEIVIQNEIGPLGIHVVPCDQDGRLVVQGIEPGGVCHIFTLEQR